MKIQNIRFTGILVVIAILLLIPFTAMRFTSEVTWTARDFVAAAFLLLTTGLACEIVLRKVTKLQHRLLICGGIVFLFLVVWAELAVGLIGTPFAGS